MSKQHYFSLGNESITFHFHVDENHILTFHDKTATPLTNNQAWQLSHLTNPVEIQITGHPSIQHTGDRHIFTSENQTLLYVGHSFERTSNFLQLIVRQKNASILVDSYFQLYEKASTIRCFNIVTNIDDSELTLEYVSSFAKKDCIGYHHYQQASLIVPHNSWFLECQWKHYLLSELGIISASEFKNFKKYIINNTGAWSTKSYLPMGILSDPIEEKHLLWQIEANGSWSYEIGDFIGNVTLNLSGPSLQENGWSQMLKPGQSFETVKVAITQARNLNALFDNITHYRRNIVHQNSDHETSPIIFNEYMLASWNCPSHETALALAPTAKKLGAEYFVIDCGWHDEVIDPFYQLGKWNESRIKYPLGLKNTMDYLLSLDLKPGLWLEPEVVGAMGDAITMWSPDCYFHRGGKPLIISNRYQLNFANPKVTNFFNHKIDDLVTRYKIKYFKFDYNIEPGLGFEDDNRSLGENLLRHNRAYQNFIRKLNERYPDVIFEACASGGNRLDYLTLAHANLVSTSDQTNYLIYPYIIANILTAVLPTQAAIWCYPKSENVAAEHISYEQINLNIINVLIGRVHLASKLYQFSEEQQQFISEGMRYYHTLDSLRNNGTPYFPKGLSQYGDASLAFGIKNEKKALLLVYAMEGTAPIKIKIGNHRVVKLGFPIQQVITRFEVINQTLIYYPESAPSARAFEIIYEI